MKRWQEALGRLLKEAREKRGVKQEIIASLLKVTKQQYSKYESGTNAISAFNLFEACRRLDLDIHKLIGENEPRFIVKLDPGLLNSPLKYELLHAVHRLTNEQTQTVINLIKALTGSDEPSL